MPLMRFKAATLLMTGYLYRLRDNNEGGEYQQGYLTYAGYRFTTPGDPGNRMKAGELRHRIITQKA